MTYTAQSHVAYGDTWTAGQHNTLIDNVADGHSNETELREKVVVLALMLDTETPYVKDGLGFFHFVIPAKLNGWNLTSAHAVITAQVSSSGAVTLQVHNDTDDVDMLSTRVTIDQGEWSSYTAATQPVVDTTKDDVASGDRLRFDCDGAGTDVLGLSVILTFQTP